MKWSIYFEPRDLWIGVYWNVTKTDFSKSYPGSTLNTPLRAKEFSVYVCLVPCFPIRVRWLRGYKVDATGKWVPLENRV